MHLQLIILQKNTKQKTLRNGESALKKRDRIATGKGRRYVKLERMCWL